MINVKQILFKKCTDYVDVRIENALNALNSAGESVTSETKSSSGDKHETGRAMAQIEQEKASQMLSEANNLKLFLDKIDPKIISKHVIVGSLVITNLGNYYISIAAGKILIDEKIYYAISSKSPLGSKLIGETINSTFIFNGNNYQIQEIL